MTLSLYLVNGIANVGLALFLFYALLDLNKTKSVIGRFMGLIGIFLLIRGVLAIEWHLGIVPITPIDMPIIETIFIAAIAGTMLALTYFLLEQKINIVLQMIFLLGMVAMIAVGTHIFYFIILALLLIIISFLQLSFSGNSDLRYAGIAGIIHSCMVGALVINHIVMLPQAADPFWIATSLLMISMFFIYRFAKGHTRLPVHQRTRSFPLLIIKNFLIILTLLAVLYVTTISLHELGHVAAGKISGCEHVTAIIYMDIDNPHTTSFCGSEKEELLIASGGLIMTLLVGLVLSLSGMGLLKSAGHLIMGLGFLAAHQDIIDSGLTPSIAFVFSCIGAIVTIMGLYLLVLSGLEDQHG